MSLVVESLKLLRILLDPLFKRPYLVLLDLTVKFILLYAFPLSLDFYFQLIYGT